MSVLVAQLWLPFALLGLGYFVGRRIERAHYASIHERERTHLPVPVVTTKTISDPRPVAAVVLAEGSVVVSVDYYKRFLMGIRSLIGGEARGYAALIDRARREAILRMRESQPGADLFCNCRVETATIFSGNRGATASVEVLAYATAVWFAPG